MANFLQFPVNTCHAVHVLPGGDASNSTASGNQQQPSLLPSASVEKLQINIRSLSVSSSSTTSTAACTDVCSAGTCSINSFMDASCQSTSTPSSCSAAKKELDYDNNDEIPGSRSTLDQALDNIMKRRRRERHHLSIARDLLHGLEDDEDDFSSDEDSADDEESVKHISSTIFPSRSTSEAQAPTCNIERGFLSLGQPRRRERHPFAVAELFMQDLEDEER